MRCLPLAGGGSVHYSRLRLRDAKARPRQSQSAYHSSENRLFSSPYADRGLSILSSVTHSSRGGRCAKGCEDFDEPAVTISVLGRPIICQYLGQTGTKSTASRWRQNGNLGAGNETRTRDLNLAKIVPQIFQTSDLDKNHPF